MRGCQEKRIEYWLLTIDDWVSLYGLYCSRSEGGNCEEERRGVTVFHKAEQYIEKKE